MSVRLDIRQTRSVEEGPLYRVVTSVIYNSGIDRSIFVFNTETDVFEHVATPWDIDNTPDSKAEAVTETINYYRLTEVTRDFSTAEEASEFAVYTLSRISLLAREYNLVQSSFIGSNTYTYTGS